MHEMSGLMEGNPLYHDRGSARSPHRHQRQGEGAEGEEEEEEGDDAGKGKKKGRGNYACGRCGQPKKGHVCPFAEGSGPLQIAAQQMQLQLQQQAVAAAAGGSVDAAGNFTMFPPLGACGGFTPSTSMDGGAQAADDDEFGGGDALDALLEDDGDPWSFASGDAGGTDPLNEVHPPASAQ
jgi:hypothetical protein